MNCEYSWEESILDRKAGAIALKQEHAWRYEDRKANVSGTEGAS